MLRDLALLQIQMRDLPGYLESRQLLLNLKPSNKQSWLSFALSHHLNGHHDVAAQVLDAYEGATRCVALRCYVLCFAVASEMG